MSVYGCPVCKWTTNADENHEDTCSGNIVDISSIIANTSKTEVRTTSSTGGQKGVKLARFDLIPIGPLTRLAEHYGRGARKYEDHQWRKGYEYGKSIAALYRHLTAWQNGEEYDTCPENGDGCQFVDSDGKALDWLIQGEICYNHTGGHHLDGVKWHAFALDEMRVVYPEHDDRFKCNSQ